MVAYKVYRLASILVPSEVISGYLHDGSTCQDVTEVGVVLVHGILPEQRSLQTGLSLGNLMIIVLELVNLMVDGVPGRQGTGLSVQVKTSIYQGDNFSLFPCETSSVMIAGIASCTTAALRR